MKLEPHSLNFSEIDGCLLIFPFWQLEGQMRGTQVGERSRGSRKARASNRLPSGRILFVGRLAEVRKMETGQRYIEVEDVSNHQALNPLSIRVSFQRIQALSQRSVSHRQKPEEPPSSSNVEVATQNRLVQDEASSRKLCQKDRKSLQCHRQIR